jgi:hypothetical protein
MQFSRLNSSKMEISETDFFDTLTIQNDQISYVLAPLPSSRCLAEGNRICSALACYECPREILPQRYCCAACSDSHVMSLSAVLCHSASSTVPMIVGQVFYPCSPPLTINSRHFALPFRCQLPDVQRARLCCQDTGPLHLMGWHTMHTFYLLAFSCSGPRAPGAPLRLNHDSDSLLILSSYLMQHVPFSSGWFQGDAEWTMGLAAGTHFHKWGVFVRCSGGLLEGGGPPPDLTCPS